MLLARTLTLLFAVSLVACSGGGGGGSTAPDTAAPAVKVRYPPDGALVGAGMVTVRGTASDDRRVARVKVNGVTATGPAGLATWQADVPLVEGDNVLTVQARDGAGKTTTVSWNVRSQTLLSQPNPLVADRSGQDVYVFDFTPQALLGVDLTTGVGRPVSDATRGSGPGIDTLVDIKEDAARQRLIVAEYNQGQVLALDPITGDRTLLSGGPTGSGPTIQGPTCLAIDSVHDEALVMDGSGADQPMFAVDLVSGARRIVTDNQAPGTDWGFVTCMVVDPGSNRALLGEYSMLHAVNLTTGARTVLSSNSVGTGPFLGNVASLALDAPGNRVLVTDGSSRLLAVDLGNGNRSTVSDGFNGTGPLLKSVYGVDIGPGGTHAFVVDSRRKAVVRVDLATGDRTDVFRGGRGQGPELPGPQSVQLDPTTGQWLVGDVFTGSLYSVDPTTGDRTLVSEAPNGPTPGRGTGPGIAPYAVVLDPAGGRAFTANSSLGVILVDLVTGDRTALSDASHGSGPLWKALFGMALDGSRGRLIVTDDFDDLVFSVDMGTGARQILSGGAVGAGPDWKSPFGAVVDPDTEVLYVADSSLGLVAVDPVTGDRTVIASNTIGSGETPYPPARGVALGRQPGRLLIQGSRSIQEVDVLTGDRVLLMDSERPGSLVVNTLAGNPLLQGNTVVSVESVHLLMVDLLTGERVVVSR